MKKISQSFTIREHSRTHIVLALYLTVLMAALIILSTQAQTQENIKSLHANTVPLNNENDTAFLAPYTFHIIDSNRSFSPDILIERYKQSRKNQPETEKTIYLGNIHDPVWLVFSVYNTTNNEDWILDFGSLSDGKSGLIKNFYVLDYDTKDIYNFENQKKISTPYLKNGALPITVPTGKHRNFVAFIENTEGFPLILAPQLKTQTQYLHLLLNGKTYDIFTAVFFITVMSFFTAFFFFRRYIASLPFISYFLFLYIALHLMDGYIIPALPFHNGIIISLLTASFIFMLTGTKFFVQIDREKYPIENIVLILLGIGMIIAGSVYVFIFPNNNIGYLLFLGTSVFLMIIQMLICIFTRNNNAIAKIAYCMALMIAIFAMITTILAGLHIIPAHPFAVHAFLISLLPQALLFGFSFMHGHKDILARRKKHLSKRRQEEKNLARLQKSKESADQARLMRIIERERELMKELREREIKRTEEMRSAKIIADKANQAKSAFLAVVSHEIRTPMTSIMGMVRLIQDTNLDKKQKDYTETIRKSGETMMALLNDILDFEKIEHGGMELEIVPFEPAQLVNDIVTLTTGHAAQKNLTISQEIDTKTPQIVMGDPTRLRQILLNLVTNAMKFTERGGVIIKIDVVKNDDELVANQDRIKYIRFSVRDTGIGISEEAQKRLFTPFAQAESSTSRKYGGTGLGLTISNKLVEAMKGKIIVESVENQGSTFSFTIPMEVAEHSNETISADTKKPDIEPMRILVTEDNEMNRKVLLGLLEREGHTVLQAANGQECLEICQKEVPDLILMDIEMVGMNGEETTRKIRTHHDHNITSIPVIALTGNIGLEDVKRYFAAQMNGFIGKPIDPDKLSNTIRDASNGKFENPLTNESSLAHITHGLELDDREYYTSDSNLTDTAPSSENSFSTRNMSSKLEITLENDSESDKTHVQEEKPATTAQKASSGEMTEIQKFLLSKNSDNKVPSTNEPITSHQPLEREEKDVSNSKQDIMHKEAPLPPEVNEDQSAPPENIPIEKENKGKMEEYLDLKLLNNLATTLGKEQINNLLEGFVDKADSIIEQLDISIKNKDVANISVRSHELKGMAGNFGMSALSAVAGKAEKAAKTNDSKKAMEHASLLRDINTETKKHLKKWIETL